MPSGKWGVSGAQYALFGAGYPTPDTYEFPSQTVNTSGSSWGTGTSATGQTATWAHEYPIAPDVQTTIISSAQAEPIQIETDTNTTAAHTPIIKTLKGNLTDADVIALSHTATCAKRG